MRRGLTGTRQLSRQGVASDDGGRTVAGAGTLLARLHRRLHMLFPDGRAGAARGCGRHGATAHPGSEQSGDQLADQKAGRLADGSSPSSLGHLETDAPDRFAHRAGA